MGVSGYLELHGAYGGACSVGREEKELPGTQSPQWIREGRNVPAGLKAE